MYVNRSLNNRTIVLKKMLKLHKMELFSFRQIRIGSSEAEQEAVNFQVEISIFSRSSKQWVDAQGKSDGL